MTLRRPEIIQSPCQYSVLKGCSNKEHHYLRHQKPYQSHCRSIPRCSSDTGSPIVGQGWGCNYPQGRGWGLLYPQGSSRLLDTGQHMVLWQRFTNWNFSISSRDNFHQNRWVFIKEWQSIHLVPVLWSQLLSYSSTLQHTVLGVRLARSRHMPSLQHMVCTPKSWSNLGIKVKLK